MASAPEEDKELENSNNNSENPEAMMQVSEEERLGAFVISIIEDTWLSGADKCKKIFLKSGKKLNEKEWSIRKLDENLDSVSVWRSLYWIGSHFLNMGKDYQANLYWGSGEKNVDLPFMI